MSDTLEIDMEKSYPLPKFVSRLRRLADALENGKPFSVQFGGERFCVPAGVTCSIEYEREDGEQELEFQIKWSERIEQADARCRPIRRHLRRQQLPH